MHIVDIVNMHIAINSFVFLMSTINKDKYCNKCIAHC